MAGQRLTDKTSLANNPAVDDLLMVVDVNDTTGSADGTSKKVMAGYVTATEKVSINNTEFLQLPTTGKKIVEKKGANTIVLPISVIVQYTEGATANINSIRPTIGYIDGDTTTYWDFASKALMAPVNNGEWWIFQGRGGSDKGISASTTIINTDLYFYTQAPATAFATGTLDIWTTYKIINTA